MAQQTINIGAAPNDGTGDTLRDAMDKCNDNFTELYAGAGVSDSTNALESATTTVNVSSATAPTSGQVLTATSGTAATWQTPAASSPGGSSGQIQYNSSGSFAGSILWQGTNTISQLNNTNTQTYYLYGTDDGGTNYRRLYMKANDTSGDFRIGVEGLGTGATGNTLNINFSASSGIKDEGSSTLRVTDGSTGYGSLVLTNTTGNQSHFYGFNVRDTGTLLGSNGCTLQNGTNTTTQLIHGTYTDASNYRRMYLKANDTSGDFRIGVEGAGTGASGNTLLIPHSLLIGSTNGQSAGIRVASELTTIAASANTDTAIQFPANCMILGVSCRVTVAITCTSTFDIGVAGNTTKFGTGISKAANTTNTQLIVPEINGGSAVSVRITPDTVPSDATGRLRVTIYYIDLTAATS